MGKAITLLTRLPKFIGANAIGTLVDTAVLWLFSHFVFDSYIGEYIISPFISFECAVFSNFLFSFFFVWRDRRYRNQQKAFIHKYIIYNISSSVVFLLKMCIFAGVHRYIVSFCLTAPRLLLQRLMLMAVQRFSSPILMRMMIGSWNL